MDEHEARVFFVSLDGVEEHKTQAPDRHLLRRSNAERGELAPPDDLKGYFKEVSSVLQYTEDVYLLGPSTLKVSFVKYLDEHDRTLAAKISGVEASDHPTDAQVVSLARDHFGLAAPRILPSQR